MKNADENELRSIASDPDDIHMYNVADFSFLLDIVDDLTNNLCNSVKGPGITEVTLSKTPRLKDTVFLREKRCREIRLDSEQWAINMIMKVKWKI